MRIFYFLSAILTISMVSCNRTELSHEMTLAVAAARQGHYESALSHAESCVAFSPDNVDALLLKSFCQFMLETKPERRRQPLLNLNKCTHLAPERFEPWYFYGWALLENGQSRDAIEPLRKASSLLSRSDANYQQVQLMLERCYAANNLLAEALQILQPLQARRPYNEWPELYNELGLLALKRGKPENAVRFFETGLKHSPQNEILVQNLAVTYDLHLNNPAKAKFYYGRCLAIKHSRHDKHDAVRIQNRITQLNYRR